ncbi:MAG: sugar transferase [Gemmatimonadales bacterium]|nr:sugar transferase [Gemmatimonadales bacterium]MDZ4389003.1 sugar transferase [Gemmatimonadales bacterium]
MAEPIARMQHDYDEPSRPMASTRPPLEVVGPTVVTVCSRTDRATRVLNVVVAAIGLVVSMPLWLLIAAAIKLTSRGPVLYSQTRVGIDARAARGVRHDSRRREDIGGRPFVIYKFRTMRPDAEAAGQAVWATSDDDRVTSVGKFLRATRLDELPQLWNVLLGDMNIVGPRPERPQLFKQLREEIPHYQERQRVRPGITGHAQVHLQYDTNIDDVRRKVEHDLEYIATRSLWQDIVIMLKTLPVMLFRKGGW